MSTLSPTIQDHLLNLQGTAGNEHAQAIIAGYFNTYTVADAGQELWLLLTIALTATNAPNSQHPQEREQLLLFYEYTKALIAATEKLYVLANHSS